MSAPVLEKAGERALRELLADPEPAPFALVHRPETHGDGTFELFLGDVVELDGLDALEREAAAREPGDEAGVLALLPFRLVTERGYECADDGAPLLAVRIAQRHPVPRDTVLELLPDTDVVVRDGGFDVDEAGYAGIVERLQSEEIGHGTGANFVVRRDWTGSVDGWSPRHGLSLLRRLILGEPRTYWTFYVHTGERTLVGASPERHVSLDDRGGMTLNPISGTYRHPAGGPDPDAVIDFLHDRKEIDELFMVLDEELKMMGRLCPDGGRVRGPFLKQMTSVTHTEYLLEGRTGCGIADVLRETMWAPTVIGSPLESACRVLRRYEPDGRGYYSGAVALVGRAANGAQVVDSSILIRTAEIDDGGRLRFGVGATLVRHSDPDAEAQETNAKARGLLTAMGVTGTRSAPAAGPVRLADRPEIARALAARNDELGEFWLAAPGTRHRPRPGLAGRRLLVVDAEDDFSRMGCSMLRALGLDVEVRRFDEEYDASGYDVVLAGPGPGDPDDHADPRIGHLHDLVRHTLDADRPLIAVCLGHQVLCSVLGLDLVRKEQPHQGTQRTVEHWGRREVVGFYNTYAAHTDGPVFRGGPRDTAFEVARDPGTGEVFGLRAPRVASMQFHPASVLTHRATDLLGEAVEWVLRQV